MKIFLKSIVLFALTAASFSGQAADYCLAIRGNGELAPAHWGAVSNVIERLGLPRAQAGGSSASITLFLLDAVASNPLVREVSGPAQALRAAFLVKSFQGYLKYISDTDQDHNFQLLFGAWGKLRDTRSLEDLHALLDSALAAHAASDLVPCLRAQSEQVHSLFHTAVLIGLINPDTVANIKYSLDVMLTSADPAEVRGQALRARFFVGELLQSLRVIGALNAADDDNLFFRPGVVDFDQLGREVGSVAQFYSALDASPEELTQWASFLSLCEGPSQGKLWTDLVASQPECDRRLRSLLQTHALSSHDNFAAQLVGHSLLSFPSTAVLTNSALEEVSDAFRRYYAGELDPHFGASFRLSDPEQVRFGYWGDEEALRNVREALLPGDEKNRRFFSLGRAPWAEVLSMSPAEPGLSPFRFFSHGRVTWVSAGGWSDLHPVQVLKAAGCENVVYITRRGGESLFAQGVAKRLLNYDRDWKYLEPNDPMAVQLNNTGDSSDLLSLWSRLFNLANPHSSFRHALHGADAILCTDWDSFSILAGSDNMIANAYQAPFFVPATSRLSQENLEPRLNPQAMDLNGYPYYSGCY